jgi:hypothetical protein
VRCEEERGTGGVRDACEVCEHMQWRDVVYKSQGLLHLCGVECGASMIGMVGNRKCVSMWRKRM